MIQLHYLRLISTYHENYPSTTLNRSVCIIIIYIYMNRKKAIKIFNTETNNYISTVACIIGFRCTLLYACAVHIMIRICEYCKISMGNWMLAVWLNVIWKIGWIFMSRNDQSRSKRKSFALAIPFSILHCFPTNYTKHILSKLNAMLLYVLVRQTTVPAAA